MRFEEFGLKAISLAAAVLLVAACETAPEESADTSGQGGAQQQTTSTQPTTSTSPTVSSTPTPAGPTPGSYEDFVENVGDRVFYDFDKFDLKPQSRATIERWAAWLKQYPDVTVTVEGHADERGTREYNLALGERRATSARNYLIALGINPDRIATISYGKERPGCVAHNEACWSQNRRGVAVVN